MAQRCTNNNITIKDVSVMNDYSVCLDSSYGTFIMNKHDECQPSHIRQHGVPHIKSQIDFVKTIVEQIGDGCVFLDIGTNIGLFSIPIGKLLESVNGKVIGFEAQRIMYYMVSGNVALNNLTNVFVYNFAVSDKDEWLDIPAINYSQFRDFGGVTFKNSPAVSDTFIGHDKVRTVIIDKLEINRVDFIKIDVEGMEENVLRGAENTIERNRPFIFLEHELSDKNYLLDFAKRHKYRIFDCGDWQNWIYTPEEKMENISTNLVSIY